MKKVLVLSLIVSLMAVITSCGKGAGLQPVTIKLWANDRNDQYQIQWLKDLAADFSAAENGISVELTIKSSATLLNDFQEAAGLGPSPDILWTVFEHISPLLSTGTIQQTDRFAVMEKYYKPIQLKEESWAIPVSSGNHLMLMVNKNFIEKLPVDSDSLIESARAVANEKVYGIVYPTSEATWLYPWLRGFGGSIFSEDGSPDLNTSAMVNTLKLLNDLNSTNKISPHELDYATADSLFREGKAAMIINGDWSIKGYRDSMGENLAVGRIPKLSLTGIYPSPDISGVYIMIPSSLAQSKEEAVKGFIAFVSSDEQQKKQLEAYYQFPGIKSAFTNPAIASDPLLSGSMEQMEVGTAQKIFGDLSEIDIIINRELSSVMSGSSVPEEAAKEMQKSLSNTQSGSDPTD